MLLLLLLSQALGQTQAPKKVYEWPAELSQYVNHRGDQALYAVTNAVFESLNSVDLYFPATKTVSVGVGVQRKVYETREISNTWVIEDHFTIKFPIKYESKELMDYALGTIGVNAGLMITPGVEWIHFRKTKPSQFTNIPSINEQKSSLEESSWYKNLVKKKSKKTIQQVDYYDSYNESAEQSEDEKPEAPKNFWDPSVRPRFSKVLNPFTIPFRLPFHADKLRALQDEEVFVYRGSGTVEAKLGVSVPLLNILPGIDIDAGANVRGYFGGDYRVAIMKESSRFAKIRVAWMSNKGKGVDTGVSAQGKSTVASWLAFNWTYHPKIVPFQITDDSIVSAITDWSFRYDLEKPKARAAFDKATLGLLGDSQDLIEEEKNLPEAEKSVTLLSHRHVKQHAGISGIISKFEFLYDAWKKRSLIFSDIDAELTDGNHKILKWEAHHQKEFRLLGGAFTDTNRFSYTLLLDYLALSEGRPNAYAMIAEGFAIDYYTYGNELNKKIDLVEQLLGNPDFMDPLPEKMETKNGNLKRTMYGRTSFYFGYNLSQSQVDMILNADPDQVKSIFYEVFPRKTLAKKAYRKWLKAHEETNLRDRLDLLSKLLNLKSKTNEFMRAFQMLLSGQMIDVFVNLYTHPTGRIEQRTNALITVDKLRVRSEPGLNIEQQVLRFNGDLAAQIKSLKVTPEVDSRGLLEMNFAATPMKVYFKVQRSGTFTVSRPLVEVVFSNEKQILKEGQNLIHMDPFSDEVIGRALGAGLSPNNYYTLSVAYSIDGKKWGQVATARFLTRR